MLEIKLGSKVKLQIDGHSALNGATIPEGSTVVITSNDPTVATIADVTVPAGGAQTLVTDVTVLAVGTTDAHVVVTAPDGTVFEATDTLVVDPAAQPGLVRITATFLAA
jgi:hypothetical protein